MSPLGHVCSRCGTIVAGRCLCRPRPQTRQERASQPHRRASGSGRSSGASDEAHRGGQGEDRRGDPCRHYASSAAEQAGIAESTFYDWLKRRVAGEKGFSEFSESVARASAEAEGEAVAFMREAMSTDWRAALEYLKRRHPERWQDRSKREHTGSMRLDLTMLDDEELNLLQALVEKAQPQ